MTHPQVEAIINRLVEGDTAVFSWSPDPVMLSILADSVDDFGDPQEAEALRWLLAHNKRSYPLSNSWFNAAKVRPEIGDESSNLPEEMWEKLEGGKEIGNHKRYPDMKESLLAAIAAFKKAVEGGWVPPVAPPKEVEEVEKEKAPTPIKAQTKQRKTRKKS